MEEIRIIKDLQKELSNLPELSLEQKEKLGKKIRLEFNYNSNHIEGNTLTYAETEMLLIVGEVTANHTYREVAEMKASDAAYVMIENRAGEKEFNLNEKFIKELNAILLVEPFFKDAEDPNGKSISKKVLIGNYKKDINGVTLENGEKHFYVSPGDTPAHMGDLISWLFETEETKSLHPVEIAAELHHRFSAIHPFDDGNGRISRLLMNYILLKNNLPPVIIKSEDKKGYIRALRQADNGNIGVFKRYIAQQLIISFELVLKAAKNQSLEEEEDWKKQLSLLKRNLSHIDSIQVTKSPKAIREVYATKIQPLCITISEKLSDFDSLFLRKLVLMSNPTTAAQYQFSESDFSLTVEQVSLQFADQVNLYFMYQEFKKNPDNPFSLTPNFTIKFHKHQYEIIFLEYKMKKLYHQEFTEREKNTLVNIIGNALTFGLEDQLNQSK